MLFNPRHDAVSKDLLDAHDLLVREGWCQHDYTNMEGQHCIMGALMQVACGGVRWGELGWKGIENLDFKRAHKARDRLDSYCEDNVIGWNDTVGRTKEEVLALLKNAAGIS